VIWFPRAWVAIFRETQKRAGEDPLPLKEPGVSLGGRGSTLIRGWECATAPALLRPHH